MDSDKTNQPADDVAPADKAPDMTGTGQQDAVADDVPREINGPKGPEPTRFGDWEQKGRCSDF